MPRPPDITLEGWNRSLFDPVSLLSRPEAAAALEAPRVCEPSPMWVSATIRRIAWGGDRRRGTARVELGAGEYEGATLAVHAEAGRLRLELDAPPGVDVAALAERIEARLARRGLTLDSVDIR